MAASHNPSSEERERKGKKKRKKAVANDWIVQLFKFPVIVRVDPSMTGRAQCFAPAPASAPAHRFCMAPKTTLSPVGHSATLDLRNEMPWMSHTTSSHSTMGLMKRFMLVDDGKR
jgi:hypothetical protein